MRKKKEINKDCVPEKAKQVDANLFEVTMKDGTIKKFYSGDMQVHYVIAGDASSAKLSFRLIEM